MPDMEPYRHLLNFLLATGYCSDCCKSKFIQRMLPMKWMAIESLTDGTFSMKTDV